MRLSDKTYDILQAIQKLSLLLAAFYGTIAEGLNLPYADAVQTVATALSALLLGILEIFTIATTRTRSTIHDLVSDTVVVDMASQMIFDSEEELIAYKTRIHEEEVNKREY